MPLYNDMINFGNTWHLNEAKPSRDDRWGGRIIRQMSGVSVLIGDWEAGLTRLSQPPPKWKWTAFAKSLGQLSYGDIVTTYAYSLGCVLLQWSDHIIQHHFSGSTCGTNNLPLAFALHWFPPLNMIINLPSSKCSIIALSKSIPGVVTEPWCLCCVGDSFLNLWSLEHDRLFSIFKKKTTNQNLVECLLSPMGCWTAFLVNSMTFNTCFRLLPIYTKILKLHSP